MLTKDNTDSIYILNAGSAQSEHDRLNSQHHLFNDILEIATGTAVWLSEIAKTLSPDAELVGLDFDTSKFPAPSSLAPNITLRQANMFEPFPSDLHGRFDVVNIRLIIFALKEGYGTNLVKNLMTLLKPGGYIVWAETGPANYVVLFTSIQPPSLAWFKFQELNWRFAKKVGRDLNIPIGMIQYLKEAGCVECDDRAYPGNSQLYTSNGKNWVERMNAHARTFTAQTIRGIVSLGGVEGMTTEEEADELITLLNKELAGRQISHLFMRAWGRKPRPHSE
ncbi:hypothetical protein O1611_g2019 [Lasiodiplodia mahajangana]|uniref:Uncharacterized protein n=1 Tax=Lasiodiplodia mahajangana TaxID=1108764 RepID=A0ACC2JVW9_9PEZI|nr:hypothetical protein O1611_g2019 [Lasiodiplodia mahajangana]